jgi:Leucine-rich repeat (LRR) protein
VTGEGLTEVNPNAFDVCPKLEVLKFNFNKITTLSSGMLKNCANLIDFDVINYGLTSVPEDLFGTTSNLKKLKLQGKLTSLPDKLLKNMDKLEEFYGDYNHFCDQKDIAGALVGRSNLKTIILTYNNFTNFDFRFFTQFQKLEQLRFGYFDTQNLAGISWQSLPRSLTLLTVYGIAENIPENAFSHLTGMVNLTISGKGIEYLHRNIFRPLTKLSELVIEVTSIKSLPSELFVNLTNLNKLTITYSQVHRLNANIFGNNPKLTNLNFYKNKINEIQRGIFRKINSNYIYLSLTSNVCADGYFNGDNLDEDKDLTECFTNWETIPDNGCSKCLLKFEIFIIVFLAYFMK